MTRINTALGRPAIFYLHPWEVDPEQPRLNGGLLSRFRHYRHLGLTESRLRRLLTDFAFGPISSVMLPEADAKAAPDSFSVPLPYLW